MAEKIKCGRCGYALMAAHSSGHIYFRRSVHAENKSCPSCGTIRMLELEEVVYRQMEKKLADYKTLTGRKKKKAVNPRLTAKQLEMAQVESEIEKLLDTLTGATPVLLSYVNVKIEELDRRR